MFDDFSVQSHKGPYFVHFVEKDALKLTGNMINTSHFIVDRRLMDLYPTQLKQIASAPSCLVIDALEENKSLEKMPYYVEHLVQHKLRRNHQLVAIGGGIIQDITCFLAANMLRGVAWWFFPTTLLAQADSCIGSKSSINCGASKNILGTFTPPQRIVIDLNFLKSLDQQAMCSGVGEMLKVHAIDGEAVFNQIANDYAALFKSDEVLCHYIQRSLWIKKAIIEQDEFDRDVRHVMNYGHTFGHAIESATAFNIPHGIAVTIGMDMANYIAMHAGVTTQAHYERMHRVLQQNYKHYVDESIPLELFLSAISKDKKNLSNDALTLILPDQQGKPKKIQFPFDDGFKRWCADYLVHGRHKRLMTQETMFNLA